jgi:hypothetical protein
VSNVCAGQLKGIGMGRRGKGQRDGEQQWGGRVHVIDPWGVKNCELVVGFGYSILYGEVVMPIYTQNIARAHEVASHDFNAHPISDATFNASARGIAQENPAAWLPNPLMHRFLGDAVNAQLTTAAQLESSSASIANLSIALEVLQDRGYQSAPNSSLRLQATGNGLGGASTHEIRELRTQVEIAQAQVDVFAKSYIPKTVRKLQNAETSDNAGKYQNRLHELQNNLVSAQAELARRKQALRDAQN